jgi:formylglycine-generating enzyme required for sulfatase activity
MMGQCVRRVLRGGFWGSSLMDARSASRNMYWKVNRLDHFGFRVARTL